MLQAVYSRPINAKTSKIFIGRYAPRVGLLSMNLRAYFADSWPRHEPPYATVKSRQLCCYPRQYRKLSCPRPRLSARYFFDVNAAFPLRFRSCLAGGGLGKSARMG